MATNNDMRERLKQVEQKVEQFEHKVDLLATKEDLKEFATKADLTAFATKADLVAFATKADLETFAEDIKNHMGIMLEDAKTTIRTAADGYKGTLERIERDLGDLNKRVDLKFSDHESILANHNERITGLEAPSRPTSGGV